MPRSQCGVPFQGIAPAPNIIKPKAHVNDSSLVEVESVARRRLAARAGFGPHLLDADRRQIADLRAEFFAPRIGDCTRRRGPKAYTVSESTTIPLPMRFGLIAGNGQFPLLALQAARQAGDEAVAFGIREEASERIEELAARTHWISLGQLGKLIELCHQEGITQIMMAGQVKHGQIFSRIRPDWKLVKVLASLASQNTDSLIGGVIRALEAEGIQLVDSTLLLKTMLAGEGVHTRRKPTREERADLDYGRRIAAALSQVDVGQSVAVCERACVALEAMEGTDAMLRRAASLVEGRTLSLVKGSRRRRHLLFDVPVLGLASIQVLAETRTTAIAVDSGRTLLLEKEEFLRELDRIGVTLIGEPPSDAAGTAGVAAEGTRL